MSAPTEASADWCMSSGDLTICGTSMREFSRDPMGVKWCFHCRARHEFFWVVMAPDGPSYYDPYTKVAGIKPDCTDLFPGWSREWEES